MIQCGVGPSASKERMKRVLATDGTKEPMEGSCVFLLRPNTKKQINASNIADVSII